MDTKTVYAVYFGIYALITLACVYIVRSDCTELKLSKQNTNRIVYRNVSLRNVWPNSFVPSLSIFLRSWLGVGRLFSFFFFVYVYFRENGSVICFVEFAFYVYYAEPVELRNFRDY